MSSEITIKVENLSKCYHIYDKPRDRLMQMLACGRRQYFREFWALKDVSFEVKKGETIGIIGRNGSGKSTLLQIICGTLSPTSGENSINGRIAALLELGAGFNPEFTGRENVLLNASILGYPHEAMLKRMDKVLEFSELYDFIDQPVKTYSSGMYARLAFATAIHVDPDILIVDETLSVGDARFVAKCMRRIQAIRDRGTSILFVSHDVGTVRTLCERAIWLEKGITQDQGDVFPVTGRYMEFMFRDEQSAEEQLSSGIYRQQSYTEEENQSESSNSVSAEHTINGGKTAKDSVPRVPIDKQCLDSRPVTHWGSRKGLILEAEIRNQKGIRQDVVFRGDKIEVYMRLHVPLDIPRGHLSVAFSIKDLKGTDLIVSTTHDYAPKRLPDTEDIEVSFRLTNFLNTGKYLLVAAVENRVHKDIHYFEYVEGAHYFSSLSDDTLFGLFQPDIEQHIITKDASTNKSGK